MITCHATLPRCVGRNLLSEVRADKSVPKGRNLVQISYIRRVRLIASTQKASTASTRYVRHAVPSEMTYSGGTKRIEARLVYDETDGLLYKPKRIAIGWAPTRRL